MEALDLQTLSEATKNLTPEQLDAYIPYVFQAKRLKSPIAARLFKDIAQDHEIQLLTDGTSEVCYPIGIGDTDLVHMDKRDWEELYKIADEHQEPLYLIHNHPDADTTYHSIPSPQDISFWYNLPPNVYPAIYFNTNDTIYTFPKPTKRDADILKGIH